MNQEIRTQLVAKLESITRAIAPYRVGKRRTETTEIAKILMDHGIYCTSSQNAVEDVAEREVPPAVVEKAEITRTQKQLAEFAARGYSVAEATYKNGKSRFNDRPLGGEWDEVLALERYNISLQQPLVDRRNAISAKMAEIYEDIKPDCERICQTIAEEILASRE